MEASADIIFAFRGSSEWLAQRNLNTYICPICLTTSPTNFFAQKDPDFPNLGNPDLFKSLPLKFLLKVRFEIFNFNSFLLHRITVTNSNCSVFFRIEVISYTERCSDLILTAISLTDISSVIEFAVVVFAKHSINLLSAFVQLLGKRKHTNLNRCKFRMEMHHSTCRTVFQFFLIICCAKKRKYHTVSTK